jgi:hypothetical protein
MNENNGCTCKAKSVTFDDIGKKCRYTPRDKAGVTAIEGYICGVRVLGAPYYVGGRDTVAGVARAEPEVKINGEWVPASLVTIERECKCAEKPKPRRPNVWESLDDVNPNVGYVQGNDGFAYSYANGKWWTWNGVEWSHDPQRVSRATVFIAAPTPRIFRSLTDVPPHIRQVENSKGVTWKRQYSSYGYGSWGYRVEDVWTNNAVPGWFRRVPAEKLRGPYYAC